MLLPEAIGKEAGLFLQWQRLAIFQNGDGCSLAPMQNVCVAKRFALR